MFFLFFKSTLDISEMENFIKSYANNNMIKTIVALVYVVWIHC